MAVVGFSGALASIGQVALWSAGAGDPGNLRPLIGLIVLGGVCVSLWNSIPHSGGLEMVSVSSNVRFRLVAGDLFDVDADVLVITANRHFDSVMPWSAPSSLIGQMVDRYPDLANRLQAAVPNLILPTRPGVVVKLGIAASHSQVFCLGVSSRHNTQQSAVVGDEIWEALSGLWDELRFSDVNNAALPVVGSGFARAQMGFVPILLLQIISYVTASVERPICPITIVVPHRLYTFELARLVQDFGYELGLVDG